MCGSMPLGAHSTSTPIAWRLHATQSTQHPNIPHLEAPCDTAPRHSSSLEAGREAARCHAWCLGLSQVSEKVVLCAGNQSRGQRGCHCG